MSRAFFPLPMKRLLAIFAILAFTAVAFAQELPPKEFLESLRQPLTQDAWGEATGRIISSKKGQRKQEGTLRLRVSFTAEAMYAQLELNEKNVYGLELLRATAGKSAQHLDLPENEVKPGLFEFGVRPSDLSFSFIFWDFVQELPRSTSRWQDCRVLKLVSPDGDETVDVWFEAEHGFPMEAKWYKKGETKPWRSLIMKGAKRFENGLWFVKEMQLSGDGWKTAVKFDFAEKNALP